jgi:valyl-tRNA synthetase
MYYFKYFLEKSKKFITIATTRPETMFVDKAIFVNPKDKRYEKYIGLKAINPVNGELLPIMSDSYIDIDFGTGIMKCTPAHDFNDNMLAKKHGIKEFASVIEEDGKLNKHAKTKYGNYQGIDRIKARELIVKELQHRGLVVKIEDHMSNIGYSERTNEVIEPLMSMQ